MAHIFESRGEFSRALEMIDLAKLRTPFNYLAYAAAGFLYLRHDDAPAALQEFSQARRLNPLDYRLAVESSRVALETESFDVALDHAVDAMLLAQWRSDREQEPRAPAGRHPLASVPARKPQDLDSLVKQARLVAAEGLRPRRPDPRPAVLRRPTANPPAAAVPHRARCRPTSSSAPPSCGP